MFDNKLFEKISRIRKVIWPIEISELKKFIPTALLAFVILLNYGILRTLKDSLIIVSIGAESISFIKLWGVLPVALIIMLSYSKLLNIFKEEKVFYIIVSFFLSYFLIFHFYLRPNINLLHPAEEEIKSLAITYPFAKYFIYIYGKWIYASFYIMAEMWGSTVLSLLFWQLANKISSTQEAKRFYPMLIFVANFSLIVCGFVVKYFSDPGKGFSQSDVMDLLLIVIILCFVCMIIYRWIHVYVLTDPNLYARANVAEKAKKPRLSMRESFKLIAHSKYLGLIAILVMAYGFSINLLEGPWKAKVRELCPTEIEFAHYMGHFILMKGVASIFFVLIGSNILRTCSWFTSALVTPIMFLISGTLFFILCIFQDNISYYTYAILGIETLSLVVTFGTIQNVISRCVMYSFFDSSKEIAYIPLDKELKTKGKAAVDVVGTRLGKSGGALIQSFGLILFHNANLINSIPYLMIVFIGICFIWIWAVINLNQKYLKLINQNKEIPEAQL